MGWMSNSTGLNGFGMKKQSLMQLPVSLDAVFFLSESVFSTVLNDDLIVSATTH